MKRKHQFAALVREHLDRERRWGASRPQSVYGIGPPPRKPGKTPPTWSKKTETPTPAGVPERGVRDE